MSDLLARSLNLLFGAVEVHYSITVAREVPIRIKQVREKIRWH